ncbi:hypothetical protein J723_2462 [Acinetobacter sp. 1264765]|nr:hypothetical protein J655_2984 [Acinetobacter sp. 1294243]KCX15263.1 hypothetical protein J723_2462 [Acinetobacter sp. 1264765]
MTLNELNAHLISTIHLKSNLNTQFLNNIHSKILRYFYQ